MEHGKFENYMDRQTQENSNFRIRTKKLWSDFVQNEEDTLDSSGKAIRFHIPEAIGKDIILSLKKIIPPQSVDSRHEEL